MALPLILLLAAAPAFAQQIFRAEAHAVEQPFRVEVNLINVSFVVRDPRGGLVTGLSQDDFDVLEDATPQTISFFARGVELPLALGLVVDFSGSQEHFLKQHLRDLQTFLRAVLGPRDRAFLVCFGNRLRLVQDFTNSAASLVDLLRRFETGDRRFPEIGPPEERILGTAFYDALYHSVAAKLAQSESRRRALLVFSDGEDNSSAHNLLDAIEAAQAADVLFYGLRYTDAKRDRFNARNKYGVGVFDRVAFATGGAHFDARHEELRRHFQHIGEEMRSSYELAYHSTNPARDGTFRKILIRPKRGGLIVRAKTGYYVR